MLEKLIDKCNDLLEKDNINHFYYSSLCLLALQSLDAISTYLGVSEFGIGVEGNKYARYLMENYGIVRANLIHTTVYTTVCMCIGHMSNKVGEKLDPGNIISKNIGNYFLYLIDISSIQPIANNFILYFKWKGWI